MSESIAVGKYVTLLTVKMLSIIASDYFWTSSQFVSLASVVSGVLESMSAARICCVLCNTASASFLVCVYQCFFL